MTGWNLPPGVTDKMIDDLSAGPCEACEEGKHDECPIQDCRCEECDQAARDYADDMAYEAWKDERLAAPDEDY